MAFMSFSSNRRDPFGRLPMPRQPDPEIENIRNPYKLSSSVGVAAPNNRRDVAKVEALMTETGNLDLHQTDGVTGYYGERLKQAIEGFQKDNGLKKDGLINPRGETMRMLSQSLEGNAPEPVSIRNRNSPGAPSKRLEQKLRDLGVTSAKQFSELGPKGMKNLINIIETDDDPNILEDMLIWISGQIEKPRSGTRITGPTPGGIRG